jgi:dihydroorotate dehydrogenase electron transfer subunit
VTAAPVAVELVERQEVLPGRWLLGFDAPAIASGARAGQLVQALLTTDDGLLLRVTLPVSAADPAMGRLTVQVDLDGAPGPLARLRTGDRVLLAGPVGRPFDRDARSRHLLLIAEGSAVGALRLLADEAVRDGCQVTLLLGAASAREVFPSSLLPDEVEYVVVTRDGSLGHRGEVADLVPDYEAWADQAFAAGPMSLLARLATLAAGRRERMGVARLGRKRGAGRSDPPGSPAARRRAFLQVTVDLPLTCAAATCLGCALEGTAGLMLRACREGPVFAAEELRWGAAS